MPYINAHGRAKKWSYKEILRVLRQALYAGYVRDGEELHEEQHQAIVDRKLWHKVQEQVEAQASPTEPAPSLSEASNIHSPCFSPACNAESR